jgi:hypothetical protein
LDVQSYLISFQVDETPFTAQECRDLSATIHHYVGEVTTYANLDPTERNKEQGEALSRNMSEMIKDFHVVQLRLPAHDAMQLILNLRRGLDVLTGIRQMSVAVNDPEWVNIPGGGRRRDLDLSLMDFMSKEGISDTVIGAFFKVSRRTVIRRRKQAGIQKRDWSELSPERLREVCLYPELVLTYRQSNLSSIMAQERKARLRCLLD